MKMAVTSNPPRVLQKARRKRGRPRTYDREIALTRAMDLFWDRGYAATSLDDLSQAMDMNRPSIYAAFGDKQALYRQALDHYRAGVRAAIKVVFEGSRPLRQVLRDFYERAIEIYLSGRTSARGCFMIGTALTEAVVNPQVRGSLAETLQGLDRLLAARIAQGQQRREVDAEANPEELGQVASAMLYLLAIQARAGATRKSLKATMNAALNSICSRTSA
jgi:TetR/AcrR family transcriptional regulator, copper-responsive repressor